jgi:hypothetical protein
MDKDGTGLKGKDASLVLKALQAWKAMQPKEPPKGVIYEGDKAFVNIKLDGNMHRVDASLVRDRNDRAIPPHIIPDLMRIGSAASIEFKTGKIATDEEGSLRVEKIITRITFRDYPDRNRKEWRKLQHS